VELKNNLERADKVTGAEKKSFFDFYKERYLLMGDTAFDS
jgi:hypothetical protein